MSDGVQPSEKDWTQAGRGIFDQRDPSAGLRSKGDEEDETLDFDQTYDGLGQQLEESAPSSQGSQTGGRRRPLASENQKKSKPLPR